MCPLRLPSGSLSTVRRTELARECNVIIVGQVPTINLPNRLTRRQVRAQRVSPETIGRMCPSSCRAGSGTKLPLVQLRLSLLLASRLWRDRRVL